MREITHNIYYSMPIFLQNSIFSLYGLKLAKQRYNQFFNKYLNDLKESEWWPADKIKAYQNERIQSIVRHAYETVPFYRRWYSEHGVNINQIQNISDLKKLPVLTKELVRENQQDMISNRYRKKDLLKNLTSGTTGTPLTIYKTKESLALQWAIWWRHKARFGLNRKNRHLTFGARVPISQNQKKPPYWRKDYFNNRVYLSTYHISDKTIEEIFTYLNSEKFDFYTGYPSAVYNFALLLEAKNLKIQNKPEYFVSGADALLPRYIVKIKDVLGLKITEQYGMTEFAGNLSKCRQNHFHLDFECCFLENLPIPNSEQINMVFTGWGNRAMPFIRYEVGDYGKMMHEPCTCGRQSACLESIDGRLEDYLIAPDGRKLIGMNQVFEYAHNVKQMQLFQGKDGNVELRIIPTEHFGEQDKAALLRELSNRTGSDMKIKFKLTDSIEYSSSGKFKAVISELKN